jgi:menaquinol-cytochrome c reductase iron-sulfur subunit
MPVPVFQPLPAGSVFYSLAPTESLKAFLMRQDPSEAMPELSRESGRRAFFKKAASVVLGGLAVAAPAGAGMMVLLDPLRRKSEESTFIQITSLRSLPEDGVPRKFVVLASQTDAWNRNPSMPIGAVYLRRTGTTSVQAFNVVCPHAGCFVDFVPGRQSYVCPCHNSTFALDGKINDRKSPSPRGLDELAVEIRGEGEVWVRYQNFLAGHEKKIPIV